MSCNVEDETCNKENGQRAAYGNKGNINIHTYSDENCINNEKDLTEDYLNTIYSCL